MESNSINQIAPLNDDDILITRSSFLVDRMEKYRVPNRQNLLRAREYGLENAFIHLEQTRRLPDFVLCKYRNLTPYHHSSIVAMDLEQSDHR